GEGVRGAGEQREGPPVAWDTARLAEELERDRRLLWAHREPVADREHRDVGFVDAGDQLHVSEDARVTGEVERLAVLELDDDAARLAGVRAVVRARRVKRVHEREADSVDLLGSALVEARQLADARALFAEPPLDLDLGDDRRIREPLR